jgi:hypothetical protein
MPTDPQPQITVEPGDDPLASLATVTGPPITTDLVEEILAEDS